MRLFLFSGLNALSRFFEKRRAVRRIEEAKDAYFRRADKTEDRFLRKLLLNAGNCAAIDAVDLLEGLSKINGVSAFGEAERGFGLLARRSAQRFYAEHTASIDDVSMNEAFHNVFGAMEGTWGFGEFCEGSCAAAARLFVDEFLEKSYNSFIETLEAVVPLRSNSLIGAGRLVCNQ